MGVMEFFPEGLNVAALVDTSGAGRHTSLLGGDELFAKQVDVIEGLTVQSLEPGEVLSSAVQVAEDPEGLSLMTMMLKSPSMKVRIPDKNTSSGAELTTAD